jgi:hypothetical protein
MIKPSVNLQELRRRIYRKAKAEKTKRFWGLYVHVCKLETLGAAYQAIMRKIRRFAMKQKGRPGCGWKRWSNEAIYKDWGLVNDYRVQYFYRSPVKVSPAYQADSAL